MDVLAAAIARFRVMKRPKKPAGAWWSRPTDVPCAAHARELFAARLDG
jgi:hypothetical protein